VLTLGDNGGILGSAIFYVPAQEEQPTHLVNCDIAQGEDFFSLRVAMQDKAGIHN